MWSSASHCSKARLSSTVALGRFAAGCSSSLIASCSRASMGFQSCTAARTSASTRSMPATSASRCSASTRRSISTCIQDSRGASGDCGAGCDRLELALRVAGDGIDRMDDQVQREALPVDFHRGRIDQEGHVVVDDLDHRMPGPPAVLTRRGAENPYLGRARLALLPQLQVREQRAQQIFGRSLGQVVAVEPAEIFAREGLDDFLPIRVQAARCGQGQHRVDTVVQRLGVGSHWSCPLLFQGTTLGLYGR